MVPVWPPTVQRTVHIRRLVQRGWLRIYYGDMRLHPKIYLAPRSLGFPVLGATRPVAVTPQKHNTIHTIHTFCIKKTTLRYLRPSVFAPWLSHFALEMCPDRFRGSQFHFSLYKCFRNIIQDTWSLLSFGFRGWNSMCDIDICGWTTTDIEKYILANMHSSPSV